MLRPPLVLQVGSVIGGRLRIDQVLGAGGMGVVAAATHLELGHQVAVKVLRPELAASTTIVERFIREARAVVQLRTEHVCRVFDVGRLDDGAPYIVMELLEGSDLARVVAHSALPVHIAVDYVIQACVALAEAHAAGIIHRDLKPANLFVTRRLDGGPLVKVLDFGIAKAMDAQGPQLTHTSGMMGSPGYMSPEQLLSARDVDLRTDIWALGVTLYQLVSGRMPFASANLTEIAVKVAGDPPAPIDVAPALRAVILRCLEKEPDRRYSSVAALAADLAQFASPDARRSAALAAQLGQRPSIGAMPVPPPVAGDAPTAASIAAPPNVPLRAPAADANATSARRLGPWLLFVLGALGLIGATIAITLALGGNRAPAPVSEPHAGVAPRDSAVGSNTASGPTASNGSNAAIGSNAANGPHHDDAWAARDAGPEQDAASAAGDAGSAAVEVPGAPTGFEKQMQQTVRQVQTACRTVVANKQFAAMPAARPQLVMCWCVLEDTAKAQATYEKIQDPKMRRSMLATCKQYGVVLHD